MCGQHHELALQPLWGFHLNHFSSLSCFVLPRLPVFSALASRIPTSPSSLKPLVNISPKIKGDPGCSHEKALGHELPQPEAQNSGLPSPALIPWSQWPASSLL